MKWNFFNKMQAFCLLAKLGSQVWYRFQEFWVNPVQGSHIPEHTIEFFYKESLKPISLTAEQTKDDLCGYGPSI